MKTKTLIIVTIMAAATTAFTSIDKKEINVAESTIEWTGKKVLGSHNGTINLEKGYLEMNNGQLTGGMFVVDMTSITVTDLEGEMKGKLEGHLKSDDFFGIANHPKSTLQITNVEKTAEGYNITGDLTIKDTTESISFPLMMKDGYAIANLTIDRTKYGVRYGSGSFFDNLGDNTISDNFELSVKLAF